MSKTFIEELIDPDKRTQRFLKARSSDKALVSDLLSSEFPSVNLQHHPRGTYGGNWEFHDQELAHLLNSNIVVTIPTKIMTADEKRNCFRPKITTDWNEMRARAK